MLTKWLRSCCGPSRLAHCGDLRSSQRSKPQKFHRSPFERAFRCVGHISRSTWVFRRCYQGIFFSCEFGCLSFVKHKPWAVWFRFVERKIKACMFYEPQFDQISQNISLPDSTKSVEFDLPTIFWWTITYFELRWFNSFDSFYHIQPIRLFKPL